MKKMETQTLPYRVAKKTKDILVKPLQALINDPRVMKKFMLATLEGIQPLKVGSMVCMNVEADDIWQQDFSKLHKQYTPAYVREDDGWILFTPKPEAEREYYQVLGVEGIRLQEGEPFTIQAQWGTEQPDGTIIQTGVSGDYILRDASPDHGMKNGQEDVWIVAKKIFEATYNKYKLYT